MSFGYAAGSVAVGAVAGAAAEVAPGGGSHDLATAIVVGGFGLAGVLLGPVITDRLRRRQRVHHLAEGHTEQQQLADLLRTQLEHANQQNDYKDAVIEAKDREIRDLRVANDRLRRRHPHG